MTQPVYDYLARVSTKAPPMARPLRIEFVGALPHLPSRNEGTRDQLISTLHLRHVYTHAEIGQATDQHYATVSRIVAGKSMRKLDLNPSPDPQRRRGID